MKPKSVIASILIVSVMLLISACGSTPAATTAPPAASSKPTLPPMSNYANTTYGYSMDYPLEWQIAQPTSKAFQVTSPELINGTSTFGNNESGIVTTIDATEYPPDMTIDKYYQKVLTSVKESSNIKAFEEQSKMQRKFGQNAFGYAATWLVTDSAGEWKLDCFIAATSGNYYVVYEYALADRYDKNAPVFNAAINSFKFIDITTPPTPTAATAPSTTSAPAKKTYSSAPPMTIDTSKQYTVTITTVYGDMILQLFPADAPKTVNSFVFLIREGFYDGLTFHRVEADFVVQGGDPNGDGTGGPGYHIPDESNSRKHVAGTLAMAKSSLPNSAGSQFYICYGLQSFLDGKYTVFGQLTQGTDVLNKIKKGDKILKMTVEEK